MTLRSRSLNQTVLLCAIVLLGLLAASVVEARPEDLRWTHEQPTEVQRFEARVSSTDGRSSLIVNLGVPSLGSDGIFSASVEVGDGDVQIEMRAFGPGLVASIWTPAQLRPDPAGGGGGSVTTPVGPGTTIPPVAGAIRRFDFSANAVGATVASWFDTSSNYSLVENDALFDVVEIDSNRVFHTASAQDAIHSHVRGAEHVWSNFVLRGRMATDHSGASLGVTTYSQYPSADAYYRLARSGAGSFRLEGRPALSCSGVDTGVVPQAGSWYRFELDVVDQGASNLIRAKVWRAGDTEPSAFQAVCTDGSSARPRQGTIGVYAGGEGQKYWDDLEVTVAVSADPTPPEPPVLIQVVPANP